MINILSRILFAVLNGIITWLVLTLLVLVLVAVGFSAITVISPFIWIISVIVAILTFLGAIPSFWNSVLK